MSSAGSVTDTKASPSFWDRAESTWNTVTSFGPIGKVNTFVKDSVESCFPEPYHEMINTAWKVLPITVLILFAPPAVPMVAFCVTAVVIIIRPHILDHHAQLASVLERLSHGMGWAAAIQSVGYAVAMAFVVDPQTFLIAAAIHLVICALCFNFRYFVDRCKAADEKNTAANGVADGNVERSPDKKKLWGLFSAAPTATPVPADSPSQAHHSHHELSTDSAAAGPVTTASPKSGGSSSNSIVASAAAVASAVGVAAELASGASLPDPTLNV